MKGTASLTPSPVKRDVRKFLVRMVAGGMPTAEAAAMLGITPAVAEAMLKEAA